MVVRHLRTLLRIVRACLADVRAVSAVEFSLLSPVLVLGTFATVDAGMMVYDKMMMSQVLRAGAQSAIAGANEAAILTILEDTASDNFTIASGAPSAGELSLAVVTHCACSSDLSVIVNCSSLCVGGFTPTEFYDLTATVDFDGVILPSMTLAAEISVMAQ